MSKSKWLSSLLCLALFLTGCGQKETTIENSDLQFSAGEETAYRTALVSSGEYSRQKSASASLYYPDTVFLTYSEEGAKLEELLVSQGDAVLQGQVIATFSVPSSETDLEEQQLSLSRAEKAFAEKKTEWQQKIDAKQQEIREFQGDSTELQLQLKLLQSQYRQYLSETESELQALQQKVNDLSENRKQKELTAPFDGIIKSTGFLKKGDEAKNSVIAVLYDPKTYLLKIEDTSGMFRYDAAVTIETGVRTNPVSYTGKVVSADNVLSFDMQYSYIKVDGDVKDTDFTQNISVLTSAISLSGVLTVPRSAVVNENGKRYVSILDEDGGVHKRYIVVGEMSNDLVVVLDGLAEGQRVILN